MKTALLSLDELSSVSYFSILWMIFYEIMLFFDVWKISPMKLFGSLGGDFKFQTVKFLVFIFVNFTINTTHETEQMN